MALIDLPIDPPDDEVNLLERVYDIARSRAHERLHLPHDVKEDVDAEVRMTGLRTAVVTLTLAVPVELD